MYRLYQNLCLSASKSRYSFSCYTNPGEPRNLSGRLQDYAGSYIPRFSIPVTKYLISGILSAEGSNRVVCEEGQGKRNKISLLFTLAFVLCSSKEIIQSTVTGKRLKREEPPGPRGFIEPSCATAQPRSTIKMKRKSLRARHIMSLRADFCSKPC